MATIVGLPVDPTTVERIYGWLDRKGNYHHNPSTRDVFFIHSSTAEVIVRHNEYIRSYDFPKTVFDDSRPFNSRYRMARPGEHGYVQRLYPEDRLERMGWLHLSTAGFWTFDLLGNNGKVSEAQFFALQAIAKHHANTRDGIFYSLENYGGNKYIEGLTRNNWWEV